MRTFQNVMKYFKRYDVEVARIHAQRAGHALSSVLAQDRQVLETRDLRALFDAEPADVLGRGVPYGGGPPSERPR